MNAQEFLAQLNIATTRRNIALHRLLDAMEAKNRKLVAEYTTLMLGWEARAKSYASKAGTSIVPVPGRPFAITAEAFLNILR